MTTDKARLWSYSKIGCFLSCPLLYKFKYVDLIKPPTENYLIIGTFTDYCFRRIAVQWPKMITSENINKELFDFVIEEEAKKRDMSKVNFTVEELQEVFIMVRTFVSIYYEELRKGWLPLHDAVPTDLGIKEIPGTDGHFLQGYVDATCRDKNLILEYKTASKAWSKDQFDDHDQPTIYSWMDGKGASTLTLVFVKDKSGPYLQKTIGYSKEPVRIQNYDEARAEWIISRISKVVRMTELMGAANLWYPCKSWKCRDCYFKQECNARLWSFEEEQYLSNKIQEEKATEIVPPKKNGKVAFKKSKAE